MKSLLLGALLFQGDAGISEYSFPERAPATHVEKLIDIVMPKLVKVHGASGL